MITTNTTWSDATCVHDITGLVIEHGGTLNLGPGVILKFRPSAGLMVGHEAGPQSKLIAHGTSTEPVVFTSYRDDEDPLAGGDTNGDGNATAPAPGDWRGIITSPQPSNDPLIDLDWVVVRYGGQCGEALVGNVYNTCAGTIPNTTATILVNHSVLQFGSAAGLEYRDGGDLAVTNSLISHNGQYGVRGGTAADHIEAQYNWWGDPWGPSDDGQACNLAIGGGDKVSCNVDFCPVKSTAIISDTATNDPCNPPAGDDAVGGSAGLSRLEEDQTATETWVSATRVPILVSLIAALAACALVTFLVRRRTP